MALKGPPLRSGALQDAADLLGQPDDARQVVRYGETSNPA